MKLSDYLTKVQSQDERDRLVKKYSDDSGMEIGVQIGYDSRTAEITLLCEIVKLLQENRELLRNALFLLLKRVTKLGEIKGEPGSPILQGWEALEAFKQIDQLIEGIEG